MKQGKKLENKICGIPLIKFKNAEIIKSIQCGKIYMKSLKWFREYENKSGDIVVGDSYEGMLRINEGELVIEDTGDRIKLDNSILPTIASDSYVFCMTCINSQSKIFEFNDLQKKEMREFGDSALLILDANEFINRIKKAATDKGYKIYFNNVHYYKENVDSADMWISLLQGTHNIAFWKRDSYKEQQEFRIVVLKEKCIDDHIELDIGDISDISKVFSTEQILSSKIERSFE